MQLNSNIKAFSIISFHGNMDGAIGNERNASSGSGSQHIASREFHDVFNGVHIHQGDYIQQGNHINYRENYNASNPNRISSSTGRVHVLAEPSSTSETSFE